MNTSAAAPVHWTIRWAFYVFILSLPFEYPKRSIPWETTTLTCAFFLFAALFQPRLWLQRVPAAVGWFALFLYVFLVSFVVNSAEYADEVRTLFILQLQMVLLLWAGYGVLRDDEVFRKAPIMLVIACAARAAVQLFDIASTHQGEWAGGERVSALGQNANQSAMIMTAGLLALIGLAYARSRSWRHARLLIWPIAVPMTIAIIQNGSRGALIALGMGLITFTLGGTGLWSRLRNATLVALALGLLVWASFNNAGMRNRFMDASHGALAGRERIYPAQVEMFFERPIFGFSPIANKYVLGGRVPERHHERLDAHNLYLEVATATGIVGLIPFLLGLWLTGRAAWRARRGPDGILALALLVALLTTNLSGNWLAAPLLWFVLAYALASDRAPATAPERVVARGGAGQARSSRALAWPAARAPVPMPGRAKHTETFPGP